MAQEEPPAAPAADGVASEPIALNNYAEPAPEPDTPGPLTPTAFAAPHLQTRGTNLAESLFDAVDNDESNKTKNFKVVVRVRPMIMREQLQKPCLKVHDLQMCKIDRPAAFGREKEHQFVFDRIYEPNASQSDVYDSAVRPVVLSSLEGRPRLLLTAQHQRAAPAPAPISLANVNAPPSLVLTHNNSSLLAGYNGSIIAYGQTGTGKTHTIQGTEATLTPPFNPNPNRTAKSRHHRRPRTEASSLALPIYNEKISDLLNPDALHNTDAKQLRIRSDPNTDVYVSGLSEHIVKSPSEICDLLQLGTKMRSTSATQMNQQSSRSHALFTVIVEKSQAGTEDDEGKSVTIGKLNLVDLAGSERISKTGIQGGKQLDEMKNINTSLTAFGKVILALTSPGNHHIPYRDSKLTRLLQGSLGGNCKTTLITAVTAVANSYPETLNSALTVSCPARAYSLKFAKRAKQVKNYAYVNQDLNNSALLSAYESEIKRLRKALADSSRGVAVTQLKEQKLRLTTEKEAMANELEARTAAVATAQEESKRLRAKIHSMERQLLTGGAEIEESPEFHAAVKAMEAKLANEYDAKLALLEAEREQLRMERLEFQRQRADFVRQATELSLTNPELAAAPLLSSEPTASSMDEDMRHMTLSTDSTHSSMASDATSRGSSASSGPKPEVTDVDADDRATPTREAAGSRASYLLPQQSGRGFVRTHSGRPLKTTGRASAELSSSESESERAELSPMDTLQTPTPSPGRTKVTVQDVDSKTRSKVCKNRHDNNESDGAQDQEETETETSEVEETQQQRQEQQRQQQLLNMYIRALRHPTTGVPTQDCQFQLKLHRNVFPGQAITQWVMQNMEGVNDVTAAQQTGQQLLDLGLFEPLDPQKSDEPFVSSPHVFYRFTQYSTQRRVRHAVSASQVAGTASPAPRSSSTLSESDSAVPHRTQDTNGHDESDTGSGLESAGSNLGVSQGTGLRARLARLGSTLRAATHIRGAGRPSQTEARASGTGQNSGGDLLSPGTGASRVSRRARSASTGASGARRELLGGRLGEARSSDALDRSFTMNGTTAEEEPASADAQQQYEEWQQHGATMLHSAAGQGDRVAIKALLQTLDVNSCDALGRTPLMYAAIANRVRSVELLLKSNADASARDNNGRTALLWAAYYGHAEVIRALLRANRELLGFMDPEGRSAIHWACKHPSTRSLDILLRVAPLELINHRDTELVTPLHWSIMCRHVEHLARLLRAGADSTVADAEGRTAFHYAVSSDTPRCLRVCPT
ncbi:uncharacterized protein MONBRDRAFT_28628 [Monosiga brevicollis MX1]|uniref:Kinesin motor domain-containing protein n=1 Tax=Monosiga brevicollis TaxID=81824 RepID=A9V8Q6_MONBE|nr:uncharacterized protein MONBRDRAFT_28628 [Monosiga brevicollis MX1]EDQ86185.1 predicted protein [Monosiga brevicollis MX1]|eukprot:XP_001749110.1 hypothetical protein [Monosiga brevicollis MX1]